MLGYIILYIQDFQMSIYTPYSFVATSHSLWWNGIQPVFVDVNPVTCNLDPVAVFLLINKAGFQIDKDFDFSLNWKYDGQFIYQHQRIGYKISDSGALPDQSATILILPISSEQKQIVESMTQEEKMSLEMSDLKVNH